MKKLILLGFFSFLVLKISNAPSTTKHRNISNTQEKALLERARGIVDEIGGRIKGYFSRDPEENLYRENDEIGIEVWIDKEYTQKEEIKIGIKTLKKVILNSHLRDTSTTAFIDITNISYYKQEVSRYNCDLCRWCPQSKGAGYIKYRDTSIKDPMYKFIDGGLETFMFKGTRNYSDFLFNLVLEDGQISETRYRCCMMINGEDRKVKAKACRNWDNSEDSLLFEESQYEYSKATFEELGINAPLQK